MLSKSISTNTYPPGRGAGGGGGDGDYSLGQYSHDASEETSVRYSDGGSSYSNEDHRHQGPPVQHHSWRQHHEYGRNLQYVNESYGDESTNE